MNRLLLPSVALVALFAGAEFAQALTAKPNVAPVVSNPIATYSQYNQTARLLNLTSFFSDPDASAAVQLTTSLGVMNFTLDGQTAPITVANFLNYVDQGRYFTTDPTTHTQASLFFHRAVSNFVIQSGGYLGTVNPDGTGAVLATQVASFGPIQN